MNDEINKRKKYAQDAKFLEPFLVEPALLDPDLMERSYDSNASDFLKRLYDMFYLLEYSPGSITPEDMKNLVETEGSQINNSTPHLDHVVGTAIIAEGMAKRLEEKENDILLPYTIEVYDAGLTHDLSATFAKYGKGELDGKPVKFTQTDLQLTQYIVATVLGLKTLQETSLHCGYLEIAEMIADGTEFPGSEVYNGWRKALSDSDNRFYIGNIQEDMRSFVPESGPVSLLEVITSADHSQWGEPVFDLNTVREKSEARRGDIKLRYYDKHKEAGNPPPALGVALVERGGFDRTKGYFERVIDQAK